MPIGLLLKNILMQRIRPTSCNKMCLALAYNKIDTFLERGDAIKIYVNYYVYHFLLFTATSGLNQTRALSLYIAVAKFI